MKRRRFFVGITIILSVFTLAALLEISFRVLGLAPELVQLRTGVRKTAYQHSNNPKLMYEFKSSYRDDDRPDLRESFPSTNSSGQRDIERSETPSSGIRRILLLGDSVVAGHGIFEIQDTIPLQMERLLKNSTSSHTEVLNFGVGGYCTAGEVELLRTKGLRFHPDLVLLMFVHNDYVDLNTQASHYVERRPPWIDALFLNSYFFRFVSLSTDFLHYREELDSDYWNKSNFDQLHSSTFLQALRDFKDLTDHEHIRTLTAIWPTFSDHDVNDENHPPSNDATLLPVEKTENDLGLKNFRLSADFERDYRDRCSRAKNSCPSGGPESLYTIGDGMHPSILGAEVAAQALIAHLPSSF